MAVLKYEPLVQNDSENTRRESRWIPAVDIIEHENGFSLELDLPGFAKTDFSITLENGLLKVRG